MINRKLIQGRITPSTLASALFLLFCAAGLLLSVRLYGEYGTVSQLRSGTASALTAQPSSGSTATAGSPERLIAQAVRIAGSETGDLDRATAFVEAALDKNPDQPYAWALLAYLDARSESGLGEVGLNALRRSYALCLVCNRDLIHWRLEFILANWPRVSEDIRLSAFESADFLRWWYLEYDYLARLRQTAHEAGIPFAAYQRKINTPVRPNELPRQEN